MNGTVVIIQIGAGTGAVPSNNGDHFPRPRRGGLLDSPESLKHLKVTFEGHFSSYINAGAEAQDSGGL